MDTTQKSLILSRLNQVEVPKLLEFIQSGEITLQEMDNSGNLGSAKKNEIESKIRQEDDRLREQEERDQRALQLRQIKEQHLFQINNKNPNYDEDLIKQLLSEGAFTAEDLVIGTHITHHDIFRVMNEIDMDTGFDEWKELPPLKDGRTDVYVFGVVGSGKSCLLAGLLYFGDRTGLIGVEMDSIVGVKYKDELIKRIKLGILPKSTRSDVLNYIAVPFFDNKDRPHPLSIIEMSGEKFTRSYEIGSIKDDSSIGARKYLNNENRKIIMFVIDYNSHRTGLDQEMIATQSAQLEMTLGLLSKDGTLDKTHAAFIVVTKCDLFPAHQDVTAAALDFLQTEYRGFLNNCRRKKEEHRFELVIHPFSLGNFLLPKTYNYESFYSSNIFHDLIHFSFLETKKKWYQIF